MPKRVVVIASGETERRAIPHLARGLDKEDILVVDVRTPPGNRALNLEMAAKVIKSVWYECLGGNSVPDKFVLLIDTDQKPPDDATRPFREGLRQRIGIEITAALQIAYAQRHLEAWYFADIKNLRNYLNRGPGNVDPSRPDQIQHPKNHLKQLLGDKLYTAVISEEIARCLDPAVVAARSPSFKGFLDAVRNGDQSEDEAAMAVT